MIFQLRKILFVVLFSFVPLTFCSDDEKKSTELVVDVDHIISPDLSFGYGCRIIKIAGGHDFSQYLSGENDILENVGIHSNVFVSQDKSTFGAVLFDTVNKTFITTKTFEVNNLNEKLTKDSIRKIAKTSKEIGGNIFGLFKISQADNDCFYGKFQQNLKITSQFPVLVVDGDKKMKHDKIKLGSFAVLQKNQNDFHLDEYKEIVVNKKMFNKFMNDGFRLQTNENEKCLVDITQPFEESEQGKTELALRGLEKLPGKLYGYAYLDTVSTTKGALVKTVQKERVIPGLPPKPQKKPRKKKSPKNMNDKQ